MPALMSTMVDGSRIFLEDPVEAGAAPSAWMASITDPVVTPGRGWTVIDR